jgi:uncharacterized protein (TIGR03437 family)
MKRLTLLLVLAASTLAAYFPTPIDAPARHRTNFSSIAFLVNQNIAAGLLNADGKVWITGDSAPMDAVNAATAAWNAVSSSAARFASVQTTSLNEQTGDGNSVITFNDDPYSRAFSAGILALTVTSSFTDGTIVDSDILFNPAIQFSTTQAPGTYDIQGILTHELGHALGANHSNILSAAMYFATGTQDIHQRSIAPDDAALVSTLYPAANGNGYGTITGTATISGSPLFGGALTAIDPFTGVTIGGLTSVTDGTYSLQLPPGNYFLYVEPAGNLNLYMYCQANPAVPCPTISTAFQSAFAGGNSQPTLLQVQGGQSISANINASAGLTPLNLPFMAIGGAGASADYRGSFYPTELSVASGQSVDIIFSSPITGTVTESNLQVIGPATLRTGSLRKDNIGTINGAALYRFTLDIPPLTANASATLVFQNGSDILTRSGVLLLTRPQSVNAASFLGGPVAPGEILSFFGSGVGPATPSSNGGFDSGGQLPGTLAGVSATFDQTAAPLFYVSGSQINLQVPYEISGQSQTLLSITYNGSLVANTTLSVARAQPGIFVVTNADGSVNGPNAPVSAGGTLVIYGTGSGVTTGLLRTGAAAPPNSTVPASVTIAGQAVTPVYSGLTPGSVGLTQVNVVIPPGIPAGNAIPLQFSINGAATQTVNIAVQ